MKFANPIEISFFDLIKHGKFDYIKLGKTKEWILNNFPNPDEFEENDNFFMTKKCNIWTYGDIEFFFNEKNELYMIFCDSFNGIGAGNKWLSHEIDGGASLQLDKWIFEKVRKLTLPYVIENFLINNIDFTTKCNQTTRSIELKTTNNTVSLHFDTIEEKKTNLKFYKCCAIATGLSKWLTTKCVHQA